MSSCFTNSGLRGSGGVGDDFTDSGLYGGGLGDVAGGGDSGGAWGGRL